MTTGVKFLNAGLARILDSERMVPQLIAIYDMANYPYFDFTENDNGGSHPGWIIREYQFTLPPAVSSRSTIIFKTLPNQGYEVYTDGRQVFYQTGQPFTPPVWYVFSLDYVSPSSSSHGMRIWKPGGGPLMYDSGNFHLNIRSVIQCSVDMTVGTKFQTFPTGGVSSFSGAIASGAYLIPHGEIYRSYGFNEQGRGDWKANPVCRVRGNILDIRMLASTRYYYDDVESENYDYYYTSSSTNLIAMAIDTTMY